MAEDCCTIFALWTIHLLAMGPLADTERPKVRQAVLNPDILPFDFWECEQNCRKRDSSDAGLRATETQLATSWRSVDEDVR